MSPNEAGRWGEQWDKEVVSEILINLMILLEAELLIACSKGHELVMRVTVLANHCDRGDGRFSDGDGM